MCCIIYETRHDATVIDCSAMRFGTRWPEVFAITTMELCKVNDKIFISGIVIRGGRATGIRFQRGFQSGSGSHSENLFKSVATRVPQFEILIALDCSPWYSFSIVLQF